jgi:glycosyltransferase involved in cell wall biosynthesis
MSRPLAIVADARYLDAGYSGIGDYSRNLLEALSRIDKESRYEVLVHESYERGLRLGDNFRVHPVAARPVSLESVFRLHALVDRFRPDLFHAHSPAAPVYCKAPGVVTIHDLQPLQMDAWTGGRPWPLPALHKRFYGWLYPRVFARAAALTTVSRATRDALIGLYPRHAGKTEAVPSGFAPAPSPRDAEAIWERLAGQHRLPAQYVLYMGSTRPNKNLPVMLEAFARLARLDLSLSETGFVLVLSADRFRGEVDRAIDGAGLSRKVRLLPQVEEDEKRVLLERAQALFFATRLEGFGIPVLEAQAAGTPVVASDADALPETAGEGALLVPAGDPVAQAEALRRILTDQGLRRELIEKGTANLGRFDWDATARRMLEIYRENASGWI